MRDAPLQKSQNLAEHVLRICKWLDLVEVQYQDEKGQIRQWECVHRKNHAQAAIIVARLIPSGQYILIKQFRPPTGAYVIEFPAGLIDPEETPAQTALRELQEETGYLGRVLSTTPRLYASPGIISESCYFVFVEVDESAPYNQRPAAHTEPEECIEVFLKRPQEIFLFFAEQMQQGAVLDIKCYAFFQQWVLPFPTEPSTHQ